MSKIKMPKWWSMDATLKSVIEGDCSCRKIGDLSALKARLLSFADKEFEPRELAYELQLIVKEAGTFEDSCHAYIFIVEFLRLVLVPRCEKEKTDDKISKREDFIALLDRFISFSK